ncbi:MAG: hypothetical protein GC206_17115 [Alphaproteobacteria bacterium]|nr:hypothetical protein [Alphaproteobacteria bacterium]
MISETTLSAVGRGVERRFKPAWTELRLAAAQAKAAGWPEGSALRLIQRAEELANRQADASVNAIRPLLARVMTAPGGRRLVDENLATARAAFVDKLLPGGLTVERAKAALAKGGAAEDAFVAMVAEALEIDD